MSEIEEMGPHDLSEFSSAIGVLSAIIFVISMAIFLAGDHPRRRVLTGLGGFMMAVSGAAFAASGWLFASIREWQGTETAAYLVYLLAGWTTVGVLLLVTGLLTDKGGNVGLWLLAASVLMWIPACLFGAV